MSPITQRGLLPPHNNKHALTVSTPRLHSSSFQSKLLSIKHIRSLIFLLQLGLRISQFEFEFSMLLWVAPPSPSPTQPVPHTHTDLGLIKRLLNPEEVCVRSFRGTILTSEYNLELGPPPLWFPLSHYWTILPPGSLSPGSFSCFSLPPFQEFFWAEFFPAGKSGPSLSLSLSHNGERLQTSCLQSFIRIHLFE